MEQQKIRRSPIAGSWYPGTAAQLGAMVDKFFDNVATPPVAGDLVALISPHAGYVYSGQTAAYSYKQTFGKKFASVVVIAPSHYAYLGDYATTTFTHFETPLGLVPVSRTLRDALALKTGLQAVAEDREHAVEIQLPFLQRAVGEFDFLPILMSTDSSDVCQRLGLALADVVRGKNILLVASTDLHHIENYAEVVRRDKVVVDAIASFDLERIEDVLMQPTCSVCGRMPVLTVLHAAQALGANRVQILHHTNSGDVTGNKMPGMYTVGYLAAAVLR